MMKRLFAITLAAALCCGGALAQMGSFFPGPGTAHSSATYQGPVDIYGTAYAWWGLRAASAADRGNALINLCRGSSGSETCTDINSDASTGLITGYSTIGGTACSVSISSGTYTSGTGAVSLTTATGHSLAVGDRFVATGLTGTGAFASLNNTVVSTPNLAQGGTTGSTIAYTSTTGLGAITITGGVVSICSAKIMYDRSGSLKCSGGTACNVTNTTIQNRPFLVENVIGAKPGLLFGSTNLVSAALSTTQAQPMTISFVGNRTTGSSFQAAISQSGSTVFSGWNTANNLSLYAGTIVNTSATDNASHAAQFVYNGASSSTYVDGTGPTTVSAGANGFTAIALGFGSSTGGQSLTGYLYEGGVWVGAATSGNQATVNTQQHTFWGF